MTLLSIAQAAERLGVCQKTFEKHVLPTLPTVRVGGRVKVADASLDAWVREHESLRAER